MNQGDRLPSVALTHSLTLSFPSFLEARRFARRRSASVTALIFAALSERRTTPTRTTGGRAEQMGRAKIDDRGGAVVIQGAPSGSGPEIHMGWPYLTEVKHASCHKCHSPVGRYSYRGERHLLLASLMHIFLFRRKSLLSLLERMTMIDPMTGPVMASCGYTDSDNPLRQGVSSQ